MFKNYLKIAYRSLLKNKLFSFINILGLGLALPFALIALMQVQSTYESDNFHPFPDRTFRILSEVIPQNGAKIKYASTPYRLSEKLKTDYPIIANSTKVIRQFDWELTNKIKTLRVNSLMVEPSFFEIFGFEIENGSAPMAPNSMVITAEKAYSFFGETDPIGKTLTHARYGDLKITGILKPFKRNTHLRTDVLVSLNTPDVKRSSNPKWDEWTAYEEVFSYVQLNATAEVGKLQAALTSLAHSVYENNLSGPEKISFSAQAVSKISPDTQDLRNNPYVEDIWDLAVNFMFAAILLILAGFNYTNLTLAKSLSRAKEVGIRKVSGALKGQLVVQFIFESVMIAGLAMIVGCFILQWMKTNMHVSWFTWEVDHPWILGLIFVTFTVATGAFAGALPAWLLAGFQPVSVLKGSLNPIALGKLGFRKSLMVIQFVVTACFIFMIGHMYHQFEFMATDNLNYNRKNILNISLSDSNYKNLVNDISSNKHVSDVGLTSTPFGYNAATSGIRKDANSEWMATNYYAANAEFVSNMKLKFVAGSNLPVLITDSADQRVLINEQAAFALGWSDPKEAIGQQFYSTNNTPVIVQGVLKNFCYADYQYGLHPVLIQYNPSQFKVISILLQEPYVQEEVIADIRHTYKTHHAFEDLSYSWYAQELYDQYYPGTDMRFLGMVSGIILIIALMGLLGMVIYSTEKRVREIGIRKVIGASVKEIVRELSGSFIKLLIIANIIAIPIGYISGRILLSVFTFHNGISFSMMFYVVGGIFSIALGTIILNTMRAANNNLVKSLRME